MSLKTGSQRASAHAEQSLSTLPSKPKPHREHSIRPQLVAVSQQHFEQTSLAPSASDHARSFESKGACSVRNDDQSWPLIENASFGHRPVVDARCSTMSSRISSSPK